MKIRVDFTIEIKDEETLRELANEEDSAGARLFVKGEAQEALRMYLEDNGIPIKIIRDASETY
jgi:hypothetical protein